MTIFMSIVWGDFSGVFYGLLGVFVTLLIYLISKNTKKPTYFISKEFIFADNKTYSDHLKMFWDEEEVTNIKSILVIFYNDGKNPIHKNDISVDYPITLNYQKEINILNANIQETSRKELVLNIQQNENNIQIQLSNDEAFEQGDGFVLQVIYSSKMENPKWKLNGRFFGVKKGIKEKNSMLRKYYDPFAGAISGATMVLSMNYIASIQGVFPKIVIAIMFIGCVLFVVFLYIFYKRIPKWLRKRFTGNI